jgi:hypothetical protein
MLPTIITARQRGKAARREMLGIVPEKPAGIQSISVIKGSSKTLAYFRTTDNQTDDNVDNDDGNNDTANNNSV